MQENNILIHTVKDGDSLESICKHYNTTIDSLKSVNNLKLLFPYQQIIIPKDIIHIIKKGESLYSISKRYNVSLEEIKKLNNLENSFVHINQNLILKKGRF